MKPVAMKGEPKLLCTCLEITEPNCFSVADTRWVKSTEWPRRNPPKRHPHHDDSLWRGCQRFCQRGHQFKVDSACQSHLFGLPPPFFDTRYCRYIQYAFYTFFLHNFWIQFWDFESTFWTQFLNNFQWLILLAITILYLSTQVSNSWHRIYASDNYLWKIKAYSFFRSEEVFHFWIRHSFLLSTRLCCQSCVFLEASLSSSQMLPHNDLCHNKFW